MNVKHKLLRLLAAVLVVTSLSSCYVYSDPLSWRGGYGAPGYRPGFSPRSYGYPSRSPSYRSHRHHDHRGHHHHSSRPPRGPHHGHHR